MKNNCLLLLSALMLAASCVSIKPPVDYRKAKKKLSKHVQGIDMITKLHPDLKSTFQTVIRDTLFIADRNESVSFILTQDTAVVDSLLNIHKAMILELYNLEGEISNERIEGDDAKAIARRRASEIRKLLEELRNSMPIPKDTTYILVDNLVIKTNMGDQIIEDSIKVSLIKGELILERITNEVTMVLEREVTTDVFEVEVFNWPFKIKKVWLIIGGILIIVVVIGVIVIKVLKPF